MIVAVLTVTRMLVAILNTELIEMRRRAHDE
jgi:hypothetical protein